MASKTDTSETDATRDEYSTYAPAGQTCPRCQRPIKSLELVRRGSQERQSGPPIVVYRHARKCS